MYKTHVRYIYINVDTSRCHNTCSLHKDITGTALDTTDDFTSQMEQYFTLYPKNTDITWHTLDGNKWITDVFLKTTPTAGKHP